MLHIIDPIDTPDAHFHDGNPATGELGTVVASKWLNDVQAAFRMSQTELIAVLAAAGIEVDPNDSAQLLAAIRALSGADLTAHTAAADPHPGYAKKSHAHVTADIAGLDATLSQIRMYRPGQMVASFCTTPPAGTLACNGGVVSRTLYADLFAAIGTRFGAGDGATTFAVPNIRDGFALLAANGTTPGTEVAGSVISHNHGAWTDTQGAHAHYYIAPQPRNVASGSNLSTDANSGGAYTDTQGNHAHNVGIAAAGGTYNYAVGMRLLICIAY